MKILAWEDVGGEDYYKKKATGERKNKSKTVEENNRAKCYDEFVMPLGLQTSAVKIK